MKYSSEHLLAGTLKVLIIIAVILIVSGLLLELAHHPYQDFRPKVFSGEPLELTNPYDIARAAFSGHKKSQVQLGVLVLLATPFIRVAVTAVQFIKNRNRLYSAISLIVLAILSISLL